MVLMNGEGELVNGLSRDTNLTVLEEKELLQVRVGKHHNALCFDGEIVIGVEGEISLDQKTRLSGVAAGVVLLELIGSKIRRVEIPGRGDLLLTFDSGRRLSLHDSNKNFESYQIQGPGIQVVV